ncbi:regenerating islet-derived protein 4-like [Hetaerina americana]|uniref:regenerating islet-derived protein 4-like n=1 Tax=Hetaerina americana TaxID=62018 RepID=UPI003A7F4D94
MVEAHQKSTMSSASSLLLVVLAASVLGVHGDPRQDEEKVTTPERRLGGGHAHWRYFQHHREGNSHHFQSKPSPRYFCPNKGFIRLGNGCYHFSSMMANWQEAHFACNDLDPTSHLASLETAWEDGTIRAHLNRPETASLERWIGGIYDWKRSQWVWGRTGQAFTYHGFSRRSMSNPHWECTFMDPVRRYRWIHDSCLIRRHYICEAPLSRAPNHHNLYNGDNGKEAS